MDTLVFLFFINFIGKYRIFFLFSMLLGVSSSCRFVRHRTCYCCYFTRNTKDVVRLRCDIILDKSPCKEYESEVRYNVNSFEFITLHRTRRKHHMRGSYEFIFRQPRKSHRTRELIEFRNHSSMRGY